ncbi:MAG: ABC transporter permease [Pseudomonadota bacterium]
MTDMPIERPIADIRPPAGRAQTAGMVVSADLSANATEATRGPEPIPAPARPRPPNTVRTVLALMMREMQTSYGRNPGGYAWAILEPLGGVALLTFIIAIGFRIRTPSLGDVFALFFATGIIVLTMTLGIANKVALSLQYSRPLLNYPAVRFTDALIARFLLTLMTQVSVLFIILGGIHLVFDVETILRIEPIVWAVFLMANLGLGIGVLNCFLFNVFALWQSIWNIATRPLIMISTTFYLLEEIPREWQPTALWNPLIHIVGLMRRGFYISYDANWVSILYVATLGSVSLVLGLVFLSRYHHEFTNR